VESTPKNHNKYGYKPDLAVRITRVVSNAIISLFGLNSNNRLSVELQQQLNPTITIPIPENKQLIFTTGHGRLLWRANTLFTEEEMIIDWFNSFEKKDIFYDIGANVGIYSSYVGKLKECKVYSFEPEINNIQTMYSNFYQNKLLDNCIVVPLAADNETKLKPFHIREFTKGGALNSIGRESFYESQIGNPFVSQTFCMKTDDIIDLYKLPIPTKVKVDVDSNELKVIEGMIHTLNHIKELYIELDKSIDEHKSVFKILEENGFIVKKEEKVNLKHTSTISNFLFENNKGIS